jgi:hypothetical protein
MRCVHEGVRRTHASRAAARTRVVRLAESSVGPLPVKLQMAAQRQALCCMVSTQYKCGKMRIQLRWHAAA